MATVDMNYVDFYNPNLAPKPSRTRPTKFMMNKQRPPLQPIESQSVASLQNAARCQPNEVGSTAHNWRSQSKGSGTPGGDQANKTDESASFADNDSSNDSLPSLDELFGSRQNRDVPQVARQNREPVHGPKHELFDEGCLPIDSATSKGNTQEEPVIIEDETEDEAEPEIALGNVQTSTDYRDASVRGLATQDTASTPSSLFEPSTPPGSDDLDAAYFSKEDRCLSFAEQRNSTSLVQIYRPSPDCSGLTQTKDQDQIHPGIAESIIEELIPSHCDPLHERVVGSCDLGSALSFEDEIRQALEEPEESTPPSVSHSPQCNQMNQENQRCTVARGISEKPCFSALEDQARSEERLQEHTTEQQSYPEQDEDENEIEPTRGVNTGANRYHQQQKKSLQHQEVGDETIDTAAISQGRHHGVEPCHEDDEDGEDEDARRPSRRKRPRMSDAIETLARKKIHTPSAVAQAHTCTTPGSTASRSSSDEESILGAEYQEWPLQGFLKRTRIGLQTTYNLEFSLPGPPDSFRPSVDLQTLNSRSSRETVRRSVRPRLCASHAKRSRSALRKQRKHLQYTEEEDNLLIHLKEKGLPWKKIHRAFNRAFPERSIESIQVRYSTKLKNRNSESDGE